MKKKEVRNITVYIVLRFLVILTMVFSFLRGNYDNVFVCFLALALFTIPNIVERKLKVDLPNTLESIIYLFIFSAQILGEIRNFYGMIPWWDTMLHTINGFLFAGIGFALIDILNKSEKVKLYLSPLYVVVVAISFSITIGTVWEFFEYTLDQGYNDTQKDDLLASFNSVYLNEDGENIPVIVNDIKQTIITYGDNETIVIENGYLDIGLKDTMKDMFVNAVGAIIYSIFGYFYIKNNEKYIFAKEFIPTKKKKVITS